MKTWNAVKVIGAVAVATVIMAAQARAIVAYDYPGGDPSVALTANSYGTTGGLILANRFDVISDINVTAVGAFANGGSLGASVQVAIYHLTRSEERRVGQECRSR